MQRTIGNEIDEHVRHQILAFLDEYCRGMTLRDVREWYADALGGDTAVAHCGESGFLS